MNFKSFFNELYIYHFNKIKKRDSHPEIATLGLISFCQGTNLICIYILVSFLLDFSFNKYLMIGVLIIVFAINYYHYQVKGFGKKILNDYDSKFSVKSISIISFVYSFFSAFLPLILIYLKNEIFK